MYLLAVLCPPLAVFLCGKPMQAVINFLLCLLLYVPGLIHAIAVVGQHNADKRTDRQTKQLIKASREAGAR